MSSIAYSSPLLALDAVVLDTETTGLDARKARIVQVGAVWVKQGKLADAVVFDRLVNPGIAIPKATVAVHGISDEMVATAPAFSQLSGELETFVGRSLLVGHTIGYDLEVLKREYDLEGRAWPAWRALDVRTLARIAAPGLADYGLDRLCEWLGVTNMRRHSAIGDARATAEVFVRLLPQLRAMNVRTLGEAEQASRALAEADARAAGGFLLVDNAGNGADQQPIARIDSFPYRHRVSEVMSTPPVFLASGATLADAMQVLLEKRISSVLVRADAGGVGILTERDVLRAVHAGGAAAMTGPVEPYVNRPLHTVAAEAFVYRAIGRIERLGFRHLGVRGSDGEIVGVVTTRNLLRNRATTAIVLGDEIEGALDAPALAAAWAKVPPMTRGLVVEGIAPHVICAVISSEIRNMTRRAAQLAEQRLVAEGYGAPPVAYAVLVLGSGGRGESQLAADQDNAIVYAEGEEGSANDVYFARLASIMCETLDAAGIVFCKGGVMAKNRAWRKSVADWRVTVDDWVSRHKAEDLLNVDIFFDAAIVHGDTGLGEGIWQHAFERGHRTPDFLKMLTDGARRRGQPFTLLGNFRLDDKGRIDLKKFGLMPIFTCARVLAIRHDVRVRSTPDRLRGTGEKGIGSPEIMTEIIEAQGVLLGAVLGQQLADLETGVTPSPNVAPGRLDNAQRGLLKHALRVVDEAVGLATEGLV